MNVWGEGLGLWGEAQSQLAKGCRSQGDRIWGGFIFQSWASASSSFFVGEEALHALAATWEAEIWPSSTPAEGLWKGGSDQYSHVLGILVAQACLVVGWGQGGPCDLQVLDKRRGFMQCNPSMRAALREPGEAAGMPVEGVGVACSLGSWHIHVVLSA